MALGHDKDIVRARAAPLYGGLDGVHAKCLELGVKLIEASRKQIDVNRRELEAGVAQIDRGMERGRRVLPVPVQPTLDGALIREQQRFDPVDRAGYGCGEMCNGLCGYGQHICLVCGYQRGASLIGALLAPGSQLFDGAMRPGELGRRQMLLELGIIPQSVGAPGNFSHMITMAPANK